MKVKIYSTPTCPFCNMEKEFLKKHNIDFEDIDVSNNKQAAIEMFEKTKQLGVPVTVITFDDGREEIVIGFDKEKLEKLLLQR